MKTQDYEAMLQGVEQALAVCHKSSGIVDAVHREICEKLSAARDHLLLLIGAQKAGAS